MRRRPSTLPETDRPSNSRVSASLLWLKLATAIVVFYVIAWPRFAPVVALSGAVGAIAVAAFARRHDLSLADWIPQRDRLNLALVVLLAWVIIACAWSADASGAMAKTAIMAVLIALVCVGAPYLRRIEERVLRAVALGIVIGALVGGVFLLIEIFGQQPIRRFLLTNFPFLYSKIDLKHLEVIDGVVVKISIANLNRAVGVFTLLLWPALLAVTMVAPRTLRLAAIAAFATTGALIAAFTDHQSSQLALVAGAAMMLIASFALRPARQLAGALWIGALVLTIPLIFAATSADLHKAPWLLKSARARLIMWDFTAQRTLENPILGVGTYATKKLDDRHQPFAEQPPGYVAKRQTRAHPHNVFLQVWYELGAVGAILFGIVGIALLGAIAQLLPSVQPYALGQMGVVIAMIYPSYGMWQGWFQIAIAGAVMALLIGAELARRRSLAEKSQES